MVLVAMVLVSAFFLYMVWVVFLVLALLLVVSGLSVWCCFVGVAAVVLLTFAICVSLRFSLLFELWRASSIFPLFSAGKQRGPSAALLPTAIQRSPEHLPKIA